MFCGVSLSRQTVSLTLYVYQKFTEHEVLSERT